MPNTDSPTEHGTGAPRTERVFLALWLPPDLADTLSRAARTLTRASGGRPSRAATLHLTLAFVGDVPGAQVESLTRLVPSLQGRAFRMVLDRTGLWQHNGIAWAAPSTTPVPLARLRREAGQALDHAGIPYDRRPFRPHVTLARRVERPLPGSVSIGELEWDVTEMVLVRSGRDTQGTARYEVLATAVLEEPPLHTI